MGIEGFSQIIHALDLLSTIDCSNTMGKAPYLQCSRSLCFHTPRSETLRIRSAHAPFSLTGWLCTACQRGSKAPHQLRNSEVNVLLQSSLSPCSCSKHSCSCHSVLLIVWFCMLMAETAETCLIPVSHKGKAEHERLGTTSASLGTSAAHDMQVW